MNRFSFSSLGMAAALLMAPAVASAQSADIRRDQVVPVVFENSLTIRGNREGDRFRARVEEDRDLPRGTVLTGRVHGIRPARGNDPGMMELEFTEMVLPNGSRTNIQAVPVPLTDRYITRERDGRIIARQDSGRRGGQVLGGALGGLVLGSIFKKQMEGVILGTIAGIVLAETDRGNDGNTVIRSGQKMGALFLREARVDSSGWYGNDRRDDRWDTDSRYDDWDRQSNSRRNDDRRNDDRRYDDQWDRRDEDRRYEDRYDDRSITVTYGSRNLYWDRERPYRLGNTVMVPLERTAQQMGLRTSKEGRDDRSRFVDGPDGYLQFELGSRTAKLNGRSITMPEAATDRERNIYVPLETLAQIARETVYLNGTRMARRSF